MTRALLAVALLAAACAPDYDARLRDVRFENERLSAQRNANAAFLEAAERHQADLRGGRAGFTLHWTPAELERLAGQVLPVRLDAKKFHRQLEGTIVVERLTTLRFLAGNRFSATAMLKGERIRFTGSVPSIYRDMVVKFQQGVAEGVVVELDGTVALDGKILKAHAQARKATMRKNSDPNSERMLVDEINARSLRTPFTFDVSLPESPAPPRRALLTGNHLVVGYGP